MYNLEEVKFKSNNKKNTVYGYIYVPNDIDKVKGIIQISHGMCEYIGRYNRFCEFMVKNNFIVCGNDHVGHGKSVVSDEELGFFADENGYKILVEDLHQMTNIIKEKYPKYPIFLLGHSMGSFVLRCYILKYADDLKGAIICGTCGPKKVVNAAIKAANMVESKKGKMFRSKFVNDLAFGAFNIRFQPIKTKYDWVSSDEKIVERYTNDQKCNFIFTAKAFEDLFSIIRQCNLNSTFKHTKNNLPLFIISGSMDPVGDYGLGVIQVYKNYIENNCEDVTLKLYPQKRHEILNEINYKDVYADILNWLKYKLKCKIVV